TATSPSVVAFTIVRAAAVRIDASRAVDPPDGCRVVAVIAAATRGYRANRQHSSGESDAYMLHLSDTTTRAPPRLATDA
ncbi:MAG: hypothetical protein P8L16_07280, partial [Ilumatobacter sp.]|nr:hypothetical protein [Ilumatobacter sp.]